MLGERWEVGERRREEGGGRNGVYMGKERQGGVEDGKREAGGGRRGGKRSAGQEERGGRREEGEVKRIVLK